MNIFTDKQSNQRHFKKIVQLGLAPRVNNRKNTAGRRTQYIKYWDYEQGKQVIKCIKHKSK